ncbi:MAG: VWA domain-containing protein [Candidatus Omnitrophica bacterium]|nr:VWA domain-containing protein [Candidatus Omnitrophota bacterium]
MVVIGVAILAGLLWAAAGARRRRMERFGPPHLQASFAAMSHPQLRSVKRVLLFLGVLCAMLAALRPQWGFYWQEVRHRGVDILVAVDVSRSMLTRDILPSRLERTKLSLQDLVAQLRGDRVGLLAFAGSAFMQCPLTVDYDGFLLSVEQLSPNMIPRGGTNIEEALRQSLRSFARGSEGAEKVLIVITDGENLEGDPLAAVDALVKENIKVYTIGVGTPEGELVMLTDDQGNAAYLKDRQGQVVKSRLQEQLLQEIAVKSGGAYVRASAGQIGLISLYEKKIAAIDQPARASKMEKRPQERFQIPLAMAVLLLGLETLLSDRRKEYAHNR